MRTRRTIDNRINGRVVVFLIQSSTHPQIFPRKEDPSIDKQVRGLTFQHRLSIHIAGDRSDSIGDRIGGIAYKFHGKSNRIGEENEG